MERCIIKKDGKIDVKASIQNHIELLHLAIQYLMDIDAEIPENNNYTISGDTHMIILNADEQTIEKLCLKKLITIDDYAEQSECESDYGSDTGSESNETAVPN